MRHNICVTRKLTTEAGPPLQRFAFGRDAPDELDDRREKHQARSEKIAGKNAPARPGLDQAAEQQGRCRAADRRADRIANGDGESADFHGKNFADREISRPRSGRRQKEDHHPDEHLLRGAETIKREQQAAAGEEKRRRDIGESDYRFSADGVEQSAENDRAERISERERKNMPAHLL